jgi:hypothetical protein
MTTIDVIAQRGGSVLIRVDSDRCRILDRRHGRLFPPQSIDSALARGYWKPFQGDVDEVAGELAVARDMSSDAPSPGLFEAAGL